MKYKIGDVALDGAYPDVNVLYIYIDETQFLLLRTEGKEIELLKREKRAHVFFALKKKVAFNILDVLGNINLKDLTKKKP